MINKRFTFQTYAWSLGTTSFRMANFHRKVEEQLIILNEFWNQPENKNIIWNKETQKKYYDFAFNKEFITGKIQDNDKKSKTARQKTSGLVDMGLIDDNRKLTEVGKKLLNMTMNEDFSVDNEFQIPSDSFLYFKQLLKTSNQIRNNYVRPFLVIGKVLTSCGGYLTDEEFTYLLPLCISEDIMSDIIKNISLIRSGKKDIDKVIIDIVLCRYNYPDALKYFIESQKKPEDIMIIGMNRDGIKHDEIYAQLYIALKQVYLEKDENSIEYLINTIKKMNSKPKAYWKKLLFNKTRIKEPNNFSNLNATEFDKIITEDDFARCFFKYLHLIKIKTTLSDYKDLNRRYLKLSDAFIFDNGKVVFTPIFDNFFKTNAYKVFDDAFNNCELLLIDCSLEKIHSSLVFNQEKIIDIFNAENQTNIDTIDEMYSYVEDNRYDRFRKLIDDKFPNSVIINMLNKCETRDADTSLMNLVGGEADVPTIFEYIVGIAWYRQSQYKGKILDYMNLSLDANLLPRTHAGGGKSDIVYKYTKTNDYPEHTLLIECTLMEGINQRHGEMEPVSRHLANYLIDNDPNAYCTFVANNLHASVVSDFRMRKYNPYYRNDTEHVDNMKIIPLHTRELKTILEKDIKYTQIYKTFEKAYNNTTVISPPEWYNTCVKRELNNM